MVFFYRVRRVLFMAGLFKKAKRQPKETSNKRTENGQEGCQRHLLTTSSVNLQNGFQWVTFASFACFFYRVRRILFMAGIFLKSKKKKTKVASNKRTKNGQGGCQRHLLTTSSNHLQNGFQWVSFALCCFFLWFIF